MEGYAVDPAILIPQNTTQVTINESGQVFAKIVERAGAGVLDLARRAGDLEVAAPVHRQIELVAGVGQRALPVT
jgi:hypothetical protein